VAFLLIIRSSSNKGMNQWEPRFLFVLTLPLPSLQDTMSDVRHSPSALIIFHTDPDTVNSRPDGPRKST
jgi:hypothetical protein